MGKYIAILLFNVFLGSVSQVMLKMASQKEYRSFWAEYLNPMVVVAYSIFLLTTMITVTVYRVLPISLGLVLESTSYIYITVFGVLIFKEKLNGKRCLGLALIVSGILLYSL